MQPYLAYNLGTTTPSINLVWTLGFSGYLIGSTLTSHLFTKHLQKGAFQGSGPFYRGNLAVCPSC
jgi:hypothetical protein